jgi:2-polyprenyl-3-methyl-5-hydroxy-6-metoxy-1,4-benzoquinol methylase
MSDEGRQRFDLQRTLYSSRNPTRRWLHRTRRARVRCEVRRAAGHGPSHRALEVGPGSGTYLPLLCELFEEVTAADVDAAFITHLAPLEWRHANLELVCDDMASTRLPDEAFDLVLCSEVIEHSTEPERIVAAIARVLRPGGALVLTTPQAFSLPELVGRVAFLPGIIHLGRLLYREPVLPTGHVSFLTRARVRAMLLEVGLTVRDESTSGLYLPVVAELGGRWAARIQHRLERRLGRGRLAGLLWTQYWTATRAA